MVRVRLVVAAAASVVALAGFTGAAVAHPGRGSSHPGFGSSASGPSGASGSHAVTPAATRKPSAAAAGTCIDAPVGPFATGLPKLPCYPNPFTKRTLFLDYGAPVGPTTQKVRKAKVTLQFPDVLVRAFNVICSTQYVGIFPPCPYPTGFPKRTKNPAYFNGDYYGTFAQAWVRSPAGAEPKYGVFPTLTVKMLAFGSIPVTAQVHVTQPEVNGVSTPLSLAWAQTTDAVTPGLMIPGHPEDGRAPHYANPNAKAIWSAPAHLAGPVVIRVSDVAIDQVPLSVGSACQTRTTLNLGAPGGFYDSALPPQRGQPGAYQPVANGIPSYLTGKVDIPAFHGCHNGAEDLDPLLTGMVSGPDNPINATQQNALMNFGCVVHPTDPNCGNEHPQLRRAALESLSASQRAALRRVAASRQPASDLPAAVRAANTIGGVAGA